MSCVATEMLRQPTMSNPGNDAPQTEEAIIVGAGPIGLACAISAKRRGIDPLVIDAGALVNSIVHYPIGMGFFTTPELLEIGGHPFVSAGQKPTREEALKYYRAVVRSERIRVRTYVRLTDVARTVAGLSCEVQTDKGCRTIVAGRVVLATGYYDNPTLLQVPGEELPHVRHYFDEPHLSFGRSVVVIGGKNSAVEAALELFRAGAEVTLVYRGTAFPPSVKYWIKPDIENRIAAGEVSARLGATVQEITPDAVIIRRDGDAEALPADRVYALTGFHPDFELFKRMGITLDPETGRPTIDPVTHETNVPGVFMAGSIIGGYRTSEIFIENGRFDGEKIFSDLTPVGITSAGR
jgi:thioredoxin reductase (NADPH)